MRTPMLLAALPLVMLLAAAAQAQAAAGPRVLQVIGDARADGQPLVAGQSLAAATALSLVTAAGARVQLSLPDGSLLVMPPGSELRLAPSGTRQLALARGGLRLVAAGNEAWRIDLAGRSLRMVGFLQLQDCAAGCSQPPGLYGRTAAG
jgi:ferric-dicitrate binding protein FerR (iron transport regulator)